MLRPVATLDINGQAGHSVGFEDGAYAGIRLRAYIKKAATSLTEANLGRVRVRIGSIEVCNCLWSNIRKFNDLLQGKPEVTDGGSGVESSYGIKIPFYHPDMPNAIHKSHRDNMQIVIDACTEASCDYAKVDVLGVIDDTLHENYIPKLHDWSFTAATGENKALLKDANLSMLMLTKPSTVPTTVQLIVNDHVYSQSDWYNAQNETNDLARIEATALEVVLFDLAQKRNVADILSRNAVLVITGGSGAMYYMTQNLVFNYERSRRARQLVRTRINARIQDMAVDDPNGAASAVLQNARLVSPYTVDTVKKVTIDADLRTVLSDVERNIADAG